MAVSAERCVRESRGVLSVARVMCSRVKWEPPSWEASLKLQGGEDMRVC